MLPGSGPRIFPTSLRFWCQAGLARPGTRSAFADAAPVAGGSNSVVRIGELVMIMELHRQGLSPSAIARQLGIDRKTVRKYIALGLEPPAYGPRTPQPKATDVFLPYLRERLCAFPGLTAVRLWRELCERGFTHGY